MTREDELRGLALEKEAELDLIHAELSQLESAALEKERVGFENHRKELLEEFKSLGPVDITSQWKLRWWAFWEDYNEFETQVGDFSIKVWSWPADDQRTDTGPVRKMRITVTHADKTQLTCLYTETWQRTKIPAVAEKSINTFLNA